MPNPIAIGFSQADDPQEAAYQACVTAKNQLQGAPVHMVIVFTSIHYAKKEVLEAIHTVLKPAKLVGCSSAGLIVSNGIFSRGVIIIAITSPALHFGVGAASYNAGKDSRQLGFELAHSCNLDYKSTCVRQASIILYDGLLPYDNQFVLGQQEIIGHSCPIIGGFSCDDFKFKKTHQFYQKQIFSNSAVGFFIGSSDCVVAFSNKHGFTPLGKPRMITAAEGPIIHTIDRKPAVAIYEEFFKGEVQNFKKNFFNSPGILYPLGIYLEDQRQYLIRYPVDILSDGSIVCQADVPKNTEVHLTINNKDSCKQAANAAALEIKEALGGRPAQLIIIFESMVRHKILGRHLFSEVQTIKEILGHSTPVAGMYSFGELCHLNLNESNVNTHLQNASLLLLAIG